MLNTFLLALALGLTAISATLQIPLFSGPQGATIDIDIHIDPGSSSRGNSPMASLENLHEDSSTVGKPSTLADVGQWDRGIVAIASVSPKERLAVAAVNDDGSVRFEAWRAGRGWNSYNLGGDFNRSIALHEINGTVFIAGTTTQGNLLLKTFNETASKFYPQANTWMLLEETKCVGTPAMASPDNATLSIVVNTRNGDLLHKTYAFNTSDLDRQTTAATFKAKSFTANPALIARPDGTLVVFANDVNGTMQAASWKASPTWSEWSSLGGNFTSSPSTKWQGARADLVGVGKDGGLYSKWYATNGSLTPTWLVSANEGARQAGDILWWGSEQQDTLITFQSDFYSRWIIRTGEKFESKSSDSNAGVSLAAPAAVGWVHEGGWFLDLWVVATNKALFQNECRYGGGFSGWYNHGGTLRA